MAIPTKNLLSPNYSERSICAIDNNYRNHRVGFRQAYLPYFLVYQHVKERWIAKEVMLFFHPSGQGEALLRVPFCGCKVTT